MKSSALADGFDEILLPGELEWRTRARRAGEGIPLDASTLDQLDELADELRLPHLATQDPAGSGASRP